jgi:hypothetical protein
MAHEVPGRCWRGSGRGRRGTTGKVPEALGAGAGKGARGARAGLLLSPVSAVFVTNRSYVMYGAEQTALWDKGYLALRRARAGRWPPGPEKGLEVGC